MKKVAMLLSLGVFLTVSCVEKELDPQVSQESQVPNVSFTPCQQSNLKSAKLSDKVNVEFTGQGVQIMHYDFEVTCDFSDVNVTYTFVNGFLNITQQGSPNQADCICHTNVSYTINGISKNEVNVIFINGIQVYCYNDKGNYEDNPIIDIETITVNDVSFDMIAVEGGTFQMGSTMGNSDEIPIHTVDVSDFKMGKFVVTQNLWTVVMDNNPSYFRGSDLPVEQVTWYDIVGTSASAVGYTVNDVTYYQNGFCYKLSQLTGNCKQFRLPTEAEWEYVARGGNQTNDYVYSGSNTVDNVAWYEYNSNGRTHPVGTKAPNELGLYDMSGNVWEWCSSEYASYDSEEQADHTPPSSDIYYLNRGGSWKYEASINRVTRRRAAGPSFRDYDVGFRLAF